MRVLALDLSSKTGWACDGITPGAPMTGVWRLPKLDALNQDRAFVQLDELIEATIIERAIECLVWEAPLNVYAHAGVDRFGGTRGSARKDPDLAHALIGLGVIAAFRGTKLNLVTRAMDVQTVRRQFVGHGRPEDPKNAVMKRCAQLGWRVEDDNAADAAAVWFCAKAAADRYFQPSMLPEMRREKA